MRKLLLLMILWPAIFVAQRSQTQVSVSTNSSPAADQYAHTILATQTGNASVTWTIEPGLTQHQLTWKSDGAVTGFTTTFSGSANGGTTYTTIGTSTSTSGTITGTGTYTVLKAQYTLYAGSGAIDADYYGSTSIVPSPADTQNVNIAQIAGVVTVTGAGSSTSSLRVTQSTEPVTVIEPSVSGLVDYTGTGQVMYTIVATSSTGSAVVTANTVYVNSFRCNNTTGTAATFSWTDTAGNSFDTAISIPGNSNYYPVSPGSWLKIIGLKVWSGTTNALNCIITAKN